MRKTHIVGRWGKRKKEFMETKEEWLQRKKFDYMNGGRADKYFAMSRRQLVKRIIELEDELAKVSEIHRPPWAEIDEFKKKYL